jgi:hypothetical protein
MERPDLDLILQRLDTDTPKSNLQFLALYLRAEFDALHARLNQPLVDKAEARARAVDRYLNENPDVYSIFPFDSVTLEIKYRNGSHAFIGKEAFERLLAGYR